MIKSPQTELQHKPKNILVDVDGKRLQINWADDHESVYEFTYLRRACPCAECRPWTHGVGVVGETPEAVQNAVGELKAVSDVQAVGAYAINFHWADGHSYGIYDFKYLRDLCPCPDHKGTIPSEEDGKQ